MAPAAGQQWARRVRPGSFTDMNMRVSDAERSAVAEQLGRHFADGRLDQAEFDERAGRAMSAKTRGDLAGLFDDLPGTPHEAVDDRDGAGPAGPSDPPFRAAMPRRPRRHPILFGALVLVLITVGWHALTHWWFFQPWAFFLILAGFLILAARTRRTRR